MVGWGRGGVGWGRIRSLPQSEGCRDAPWVAVPVCRSWLTVVPGPEQGLLLLSSLHFHSWNPMRQAGLWGSTKPMIPRGHCSSSLRQQQGQDRRRDSWKRQEVGSSCLCQGRMRGGPKQPFWGQPPKVGLKGAGSWGWVLQAVSR